MVQFYLGRSNNTIYLYRITKEIVTLITTGLLNSISNVPFDN